MKMNKKKLLVFGLVGLFAVALVSAIGYYALFSASFTVLPAITLSECNDVIEGDIYSGSTLVGSACTLTNEAPTERALVISNDAVEGIEVTYKGTLELSKKDTSTWIPFGDIKTIGYTIIGDIFEVTDIPPGYTLIYYPNTEGDIFTTNVANVLVYGTDTIGNLPIELDVGDDYCTNGFNPTSTQCVGGKLWLIEGDETTALAKLNSWDASEFYFETSLIQYNSGGEITLSPGASLTLTPVYEIGAGVTGEQVIETTIA